MGKLTLILGGLLIASVAGSAWYIDRLLDEISVLKANAIVLETKVAEQNNSIKNYLETQKKVQQQIQTIEKQKQEALREVNQLRNTFSKHDLDNLALSKPKLIEKIVNKGTKKVKEELIALTDPDQFEEKNEEDTNNN
jgi:biopolymer transport protein ExbB/TolQ